MHLQAAAAGPQTDTAHFAGWEAHTRGVGSKLMAAMGYRQGQGLGPHNAGAAAPIEVNGCPFACSHGAWQCSNMRSMLAGSHK